METNKNIQDKIKDTLSSADKIAQVNVPPFFKDKTLELLFAEKEKKQSILWSWFTPQFQITTLIVVVALNVFAITQLDSNASGDEIDEFAQTYSLSAAEYQSVFN
nr:hypothetical protein [uncultured Psychroserpens sp.]